MRAQYKNFPQWRKHSWLHQEQWDELAFYGVQPYGTQQRWVFPSHVQTHTEQKRYKCMVLRAEKADQRRSEEMAWMEGNHNASHHLPEKQVSLFPKSFWERTTPCTHLLTMVTMPLGSLTKPLCTSLWCRTLNTRLIVKITDQGASLYYSFRRSQAEGEPQNPS